MPIYGELGRYPLSITLKQRMICYWTRILKSNQHKLNKVMYDILYNLHCKDIHLSGWIKCINTIFQNNGMSYIWATQDFKVDSNNVHLYINVNVTSLNNSGTAGLHVMLLIVII